MIGFDDIDLAEIVGLTTIRQPLREGGALAADLLLAAIEHGVNDPVEELQELCGRRATHDVIDDVLSPEGWPYASAPPVEPGDPGRYHALFGRDSLITALQLLPARPDVARATLRALAERQGVRDDPLTGEEPGKIGHEFRDAPPEPFVEAGWPDPGEFRYYGTADATAWFIVLARAVGGFEDARGRCRGLARPDAGRRAAAPFAGAVRPRAAGLARHDRRRRRPGRWRVRARGRDESRRRRSPTPTRRRSSSPRCAHWAGT